MMDATTPWDDLGLTGGCWGDAAESIPAENTSRSPEASELIQLRSWSHSIEIPDRHRKQWPPTHTHDLQAAQALTSLSHSPFGTFEHDGSVDCCRPCDRQCDPNEIFECFSIDTEPCYDANCEQTCEFDGVNTLCNDTHLNNVNDILCCLHEGCSFRAFSEQELLHHCTITHACGGRTQRECRNQFIPSSNWVQTHVHNEHCKDGFINPLLLHPDGCSSKSFSLGEHQTYNNHNFSYPSQNEEIYGELQEIASFGQKPCCHDPNRTGPCIQDGLRHVEKARVGAKQIGQASKASSPETFTATASSEVTCPSPTSSTNLNGLDKLVNNSSSAGQIFACCWISEQGSSGPCSLAFKSALELQTHIEDSHLALSECPSNSRNGERIICRWQGCPFAQTKKRWRQVQHLKDHVRTHSKHKAYRCDQCQRLFSEKKSLEQHRRIHTGEKPFKCEECGSCFSHQSTLSTHRRTHTGEKPYHCKLCGHKDADHANFQRHKLIHEPAKYKCEHCNAEFKKKANMLRHQKQKACRGLKE